MIIFIFLFDEFIIVSLPWMVHHPQSIYLCNSSDWMNIITVRLTFTTIKSYYCNTTLPVFLSKFLAYRKSVLYRILLLNHFWEALRILTNQWYAKQILFSVIRSAVIRNTPHDILISFFFPKIWMCSREFVVHVTVFHHSGGGAGGLINMVTLEKHSHDLFTM